MPILDLDLSTGTVAFRHSSAADAGLLDGLWKELLLPRGTLGYLDWVSGIVRLNMSRADYDFFLQGTLPVRRRRTLLSTIHHEALHVLQIVFSGFLYGFVTNARGFVSATLAERRGFAFERAESTSSPDRTTWVCENGLRKMLAKLDEIGEHKLSIRAIVESLTLLTETREQQPSWTHRNYIRYLGKEAPGTEYRSAFEFVTSKLGESAFEWFPTLAHMALCSHEPVAVLASLCDEARRLDVHRLPQPDWAAEVERGERLLETAMYHPRWLGRAIDVVSHMPQHPVYTPLAEQSRSLWDNGDMANFMAAPHLATANILSLGVVPILLNPDPHESRIWPYVHFGACSASEAAQSVLTAAISRRVLGTVRP